MKTFYVSVLFRILLLVNAICRIVLVSVTRDKDKNKCVYTKCALVQKEFEIDEIGNNNGKEGKLMYVAYRDSNS